jgi:hypothetical protein
MPDIDKAIAFAGKCLKWRKPALASDANGKIIVMDYQDPTRILDPSNIQHHVEAFLGKRFFIQISGGSSKPFKWSVVVGLRSRVGAQSMHDHDAAVSDDMHDAIFDACVAAVRLYPDT